STPLEDGRCPSELLMGRRIRSRLPDFAPADGREYRRSREHLLPTNEDLRSSDYFEEHLEDSPACPLTSIQAVPAALTPTVQHDDPAITTTVATSMRAPTSSPAAVNSAARTEDDRASELGPCAARTSTRT
ncbi:hypothetical protein HPB47_021462, partial [Ixodes persulcatus]